MFCKLVVFLKVAPRLVTLLKSGISVAEMVVKLLLLHPRNILVILDQAILPHCGISIKSDLLPILAKAKVVKAPVSPIAPIETVEVGIPEA